jgi:hypothetical protein
MLVFDAYIQLDDMPTLVFLSENLREIERMPERNIPHLRFKSEFGLRAFHDRWKLEEIASHDKLLSR